MVALCCAVCSITVYEMQSHESSKLIIIEPTQDAGKTNDQNSRGTSTAQLHLVKINMFNVNTTLANGKVMQLPTKLNAGYESQGFSFMSSNAELSRNESASLFIYEVERC